MGPYEKAVLERHSEAKVMVKELMTGDVRCRNQDVWLCLQVWKKQGIRIQVHPDDVERMINPETVIRARAEIQNDEGLLLPTDPRILVKRKIRESLIRNYYSGNHDIWAEWQNLKYKVK